LAHTKI
jgi:hypothetical protein